MRHFLITIILAGILPVLFSSCDLFNNQGYPNKVRLPKEGGTKVIKGNDSLYSFCICENGVSVSDSSHLPDTISAKYEWLEVAVMPGGVNEIRITAQPFFAPGKRTLEIDGLCVARRVVIRVEQ